jgi:hypothetical protein
LPKQLFDLLVGGSLLLTLLLLLLVLLALALSGGTTF